MPSNPKYQLMKLLPHSMQIYAAMEIAGPNGIFFSFMTVTKIRPTIQDKIR